MSATEQSEKGLLKDILPKDLLSLAQYLLLIFGGVGAVVSLFGDYSDGGELLGDFFYNKALYIVSILHLVLVVLVLFPGRLRIDDFYDFRKEYRKNNKTEQKKIKEQEFIFKQSRKFIKYWTYIWMSWGALYVIFFLDEFWKQNTPYMSASPFSSLFKGDATVFESSKPNHVHDVKLVIDFFMRLANNLGTYFMILLVITLLPSSNSKDLRNRFLVWNTKNGWVFIVSIIIVDLTAVVLFTKIYNCNIKETGEILSNIYGVFAATFLAMIAGRLDSYYFDAKPNWAYVLFIYAALQASFPFYTAEGNDEIKVTVAYTAFTLKGLFYVFVMKQFENWRMYYYLSAYSNKTSWFTYK